ncbi:hypothetical protein NL676_032539 [Syzygium grande]|nr:hypothetical protein NL676_032539 [Syzygium grande]
MLIRLGGIPTVIVSSPGAAREVLKNHDLDCCSRPRLVGTGRLSYDYLDIAFVEYGDYWRELRKLCMLELFSTKRVQSFRYIREEEVGSMMESIAKSAESGIPINMSEKFMALTANVTCRVAFGKAFQGTEFDDRKFMDVINEAVAMLGSFSASDFSPRFGWIVDRFTGLHSRLEKSFRSLDIFYQKVIEDHRNAKKSHEEEEDIVDLLLKMERDKTELAGVPLKKDNIKAILMDIFLAGVHTVALVMDWTMAELARNPRVMQKVREEIRSCAGNKKWLVEDDLGGLEYLKLVLKEALRVAFGKAFQGTEFDDRKFMDVINEAVAMLGSFSASDFSPRFGWIVDRFTGLHSRLEKSFLSLDIFYQKVIEEHRNAKKSHEEEEDIVDLLLKMERDKTELAGVPLKKDNIKAILMDIFLAGVHTVALVMDWTMAELARNPRVMQKVREEIRVALETRNGLSKTTSAGSNISS